jgi:hypothetical protein
LFVLRKKPFVKNSSPNEAEKLKLFDSLKNKESNSFMLFNRDIYTSGFLDKLDKTGAIASWACAVHCLAAPFAVSFLPIFGLGFLADEQSENLFLAGSLLLASLTILPAFFKLHRNFGILFLFFVGIFLVGAADRFFEENFTGKIIFVALGAGLMTAAHLFNRRLCRACRKCGENGCAVR